MKCKKSKCNAYAIKESELCFVHNPESKQQHLEAASKDGHILCYSGG